MGPDALQPVDRLFPKKRLDYQEYQGLIYRIRTTVNTAIPSTATVIVVSKGDPELLKLGGRRAWHFPRLESSVYAGYYPADSAEAIAHLEALREKGGDYLLFPQTAFWWLDHYAEFRQHLEEHYRVVVRQEETCLIFALNTRTSRPGHVVNGERLAYQQLIRQLREVVDSILPPDATVLVVSKGDEELRQLGRRRAWHFPQNANGAYAGYYPADSAEAIAHLEACRAQGADYLLFPQTAFWWLDHYVELRQFLEQHCRRVVWQRHVCLIFALERTHTKHGNVATPRPRPEQGDSWGRSPSAALAGALAPQRGEGTRRIKQGYSNGG